MNSPSPRNSKISKDGKHHAAADGATNTRTVKVYRYDPEDGQNPRLDTYEVDMTGTSMVLDVLIKIKDTMDPTLSLPAVLP